MHSGGHEHRYELINGRPIEIFRACIPVPAASMECYCSLCKKTRREKADARAKGKIYEPVITNDK